MGRFAPPEPGYLSGNFTVMLQEDCPECPWWPERRPMHAADPLPDLLGANFDAPNVTAGNAFAFWDPSVKPVRRAGVSERRAAQSDALPAHRFIGRRGVLRLRGPQEAFAQVPMWFEGSIPHVRRGWVLGRHAPVQGPMVLGHVHAWHLQMFRAHKAMVRKVRT